MQGMNASHTNSVQALQEFRPNYYDLVILDIKMPKLDGFALCEKIREIENTVQIIFITVGEVSMRTLEGSIIQS